MRGTVRCVCDGPGVGGALARGVGIGVLTLTYALVLAVENENADFKFIFTSTGALGAVELVPVHGASSDSSRALSLCLSLVSCRLWWILK